MTTQQELESRIRNNFHQALWEVFNKYKVLTIKTNWQVRDKTYGEVGGRFLEDFMLSAFVDSLDDIRKYSIVNAYPPRGRRTMEDLIVEWQMSESPRQRLLISVKGHKLDTASNPNLVSLRKAKSFYLNHPKDTHVILIVAHYLTERIAKDGFRMQIQRIDVCHLKDLLQNHLSLQTIGAGGQFLLCSIDNIQTKYRTPQEFYNLICEKEKNWLERR